MRPIALILALAWPIMVGAVQWDLPEGDALRAVLEGKKLEYTNGAWQEFYASGRTLYNAGEDSWGYWRIDGDLYCSQWPPSGLWDCYSVWVDEPLVRFVGEGGDFVDGYVVED